MSNAHNGGFPVPEPYRAHVRALLSLAWPRPNTDDMRQMLDDCDQYVADSRRYGLRRTIKLESVRISFPTDKGPVRWLGLDMARR